MQDAQTDYNLVDSERQRQIVRKYVLDEREGRRLVQLELYERHIDIVYNLIDLQRCIKEWQNRDPRKMIREDPREEVLLMRIRTVEIACWPNGQRKIRIPGEAKNALSPWFSPPWTSVSSNHVCLHRTADKYPVRP